MSTSARHWNSGAAMGTVLALKERKSRKAEKPYLELRLAVPSGEGRDMTVVGRLWGEERITEFKAAHAAEPGRAWQFLGLFAQFKGEGRRLDGFNFYKYSRFEPTARSPLRATVALTGELKENLPCDDGTGLSRLVVKVKNDTTDQEFEVFAPEGLALGVGVFSVVRFHGVLRDMGAYYNAEADIRTVADRLQAVGGKEPF